MSRRLDGMKALLTLLLGLSGCSRDVRQPPLQAMAIEIDTLPTLLIAGFSADESDAFGDPRGVRRLADGSILGLDAATRQLGVWKDNGVLRWKVGREGSGPGEFREPQVVGTVGVDSIFVYDASLRRLSLWRVDHGLVNEWRTPTGVTGNLQPVGIIDGAVIARVLRFAPPAPSATLVHSVATIVRWQVDGSRIDTLVEVANGASNVGGYRYYAWRSFAMTTDSSVVYGRGDSTVLHEIDMRGREIATYRWNAVSRLVTEADRKVIQALGSAAGAQTTRIDDREIANTVPLAGRILRDQAGGIWIPAYEEISRYADRATVLTADGSISDSITLPPRFRLSFVDSVSVLGVFENAGGARMIASFSLKRRTLPLSAASIKARK